MLGGRHTRRAEAHPRKMNSQAAGLLLQERGSSLSQEIFKEKLASSPGPLGCRARWLNYAGSSCCAGGASQQTHLSPRGRWFSSFELADAPARTVGTLIAAPLGAYSTFRGDQAVERWVWVLRARSSQSKSASTPGPCLPPAGAAVCSRGWGLLPGGQTGALTIIPKMGCLPATAGHPQSDSTPISLGRCKRGRRGLTPTNGVLLWLDQPPGSRAQRQVASPSHLPPTASPHPRLQGDSLNVYWFVFFIILGNSCF